MRPQNRNHWNITTLILQMFYLLPQERSSPLLEEPPVCTGDTAETTCL